MRSPVAGLVVILLSVGCSTASTPTSPSVAAKSAEVASGSEAALTSTAAKSAVPFKGDLVGNQSPFPPVPDPPGSTFLSVHLSASGHATHLGKFTMESSHRVNLLDGSGIGDATFTAADGSTLRTTVEGQATPISLPNLFTVVETHTIIGGTGRFTGATGSFVITRSADFTNPFTAGSIDGELIKH